MMDDFIISRDAYFLILIEKFQVEDPFNGQTLNTVVRV